MGGFAAILTALVASLLAPGAAAQAIEVPYKGLRYHMLSRGGVTVMIALLGHDILEFTTAQVWISNGSRQPVRIAPQSFTLHLETPGSGATAVEGAPDKAVLREIRNRARPKDLQELVRTYELALFGFANERSLGYYQQRKQAALAQFGGKLRAMATASAVMLPERMLKPGEAIDGTVFFRNEHKVWRATALSASLAGSAYDFPEIAGQQVENNREAGRK